MFLQAWIKMCLKFKYYFEDYLYHLVTFYPQVVTAASIMNLKIRCAGAGHSWAPLFPDENQVLMDLSLLTITPRMTFNPTEVSQACQTIVLSLLRASHHFLKEPLHY